jgi:hypothetical protein
VLHVGVDAYKANSLITIVDEARGILELQRVASSWTGVHQALRNYQGEVRKAILETGYGLDPIYDWLEEIAHEVGWYGRKAGAMENVCERRERRELTEGPEDLVLLHLLGGVWGLSRKARESLGSIRAVHASRQGAGRTRVEG